MSFGTNRFWLRSAMGLLSLAACACAAQSTDWPGYLGPTRDGRSPEKGLLKSWPDGGPKLLWKVGDIGAGWSSLAIAGTRILTTGNENDSQMLYCYSDSGKLLWKVVQGPKCSNGGFPGARSTPTVDGTRVYVTGGNGLVSCHDLFSGKTVWKRDMVADFGGQAGGWLYAESVLVLGNMAVITPGGKHAIVALNKANGEPLWESDLSVTAGYSSCIAIRGQPGTLIVNGSGDGLVAVDARTGRKVWSHDFAAGNTANCPTPVYADGHIFWSVGYGKGSVCIKLESTGSAWKFSEAWRSNEMSVHVANYIIDKGCVYGGGFACLDLKTGATRWKSGEVRGGTMCLADGMFYIMGANGGQVWLVEPRADGCKVSGSFKVEGHGESWASPAVVDGRLYLRYDKNIYCYDVKAR
jgi:outer membrane protein assembly factor BamB